MAVLGLLGDIHGNREALLATLALFERRGIARIACVGDIVGYNADPDECAALLRERHALAIAGNHDLIGLGRLGFGRCSNNAMYSLKRTRRSLAADTVAYLSALPPHRVLEDGVVLVHGGVRDVEQYMRLPVHIGQNAEWLGQDFPEARVCFFGHTHDQKIYEVRGGLVQELCEQKSQLKRDAIYFINPGSVDASRKREHKFAECAIFDSTAWTVEFLRVPYDSAATEAKAAVFGYRISPLIDRLYSMRRRLQRIARKLLTAQSRSTA
jgi:predicted phosphodiesterase